MTAHADVAQVLEDGRVRGIYVHVAEPEMMLGTVLAKHYADAPKVAALLDLGDMSYVETTLEECCAYGRDRGETGCEARLYPNLQAFLRGDRETSSVVYVFREGQWFASIHDGELYRLKKTGYVEWHGKVVPLMDDLVVRAKALGRTFDQAEVIEPVWDAGHGVMLHLDDRFRRRGNGYSLVRGR